MSTPDNENTKMTAMQSARVISISQLSPTVKHLCLQLTNSNSDFVFKPGQWVDFTAAHLKDEVAGYSIASTPKLLKEKSQFELSIQISSHIVSKWVHHSCKVDDVVMVKVGGDFCLNEERSAERFRRFLLIGGGVGINPLYSIMRHIVENESVSDNVSNVRLLFSAKSQEELLFKTEIEALCSSNSSKLSSQFYITKSNEDPDTSNQSIRYRRIQPDDLKASLEGICSGSLSKDQLKEVGCFMCGPSAMVSYLEPLLTQYLEKDQLFYENWY